VSRPPRFSVVIPSRNRATLLRHSINSVVRQHYTDLEIVVSDNASEEDYAALVASFPGVPLRLLRSEVPLAVTDSWNRAIDAATGDYVVMLGDDDALAPGYFSAADRLIDQFDGPEVIYSPAYHYAWPGVVPGQPNGYLASVLNSELFRASAPYRLDPAEGQAMAQRALRFRHDISFNAQHFLYSRGFLNAMRLHGQVYQSPYPDYYACFFTFLRARDLIVDPVPRTVIGIAKQSFGFFYLNNREDEGAAAFLAHLEDGTDLTRGVHGAAAALAMPGSRHLRSWLCAALTTRQRIGDAVDVFVDVPRYRRLQCFELAVSAGHDHRITAKEFRQSLEGLTETERRRSERLYQLFRTMARNRDVAPSALAWGMRKLLQVHGPADIAYLDIQEHDDISDAIDWLDRQGASADGTPPDPGCEASGDEHPPAGSSDLPPHQDAGLLEPAVSPPATPTPPPGSLAKVTRNTRRLASAAVRLAEAENKPAELRRLAGRIRGIVVRYPLLRAAIRVPWRLALRISPTLRRVVERRHDVGEIAVAVMTSRATNVDAIGAAALTRLHAQGSVAISRFAPAIPLNLYIDEARGNAAELQILLPSLRKEHATGGPNTAYLLGCALAAHGIPVRFLATDASLDPSLEPIVGHLRALTGQNVATLPIRFADASVRAKPLGVGRNDVLMATAWWTAQMAHAAAPLLGSRRIYYLIQDFEPLFYGASENWVQALETYGFHHQPIINTSLLRDELVANRIGRFADPAFASGALTFEPAVDRTLFHPAPRRLGSPRRLLFYARPTVGLRNLFGMGVAALSAAIEAGLFDPAGWEFLGMGEAFEPVPLGRGATLVPAPWLGFEGYAEQMRGADILLSLMVSPHPSYPPLEMAACGAPAVTTVYGVKTAARLAAVSPSIIAVEPSVGALVWGLQRALRQADASYHGQSVATLHLPSTWAQSLAPIIGPLISQLAIDGLRPSDATKDLPVMPAQAPNPEGSNRAYYDERRQAARRLYRPSGTPRLLSIISTVYDTDAAYLHALAHSLFSQDTLIDFEWVLLDNGSTKDETLEALTRIAGDPRVRLGRVEQNLGIIGGMRWCLEQAAHRYIVPVDSDDIIAPHGLRALSAALEQHGMPALLYTDEDKIDGVERRDLYRKTDWDPVLFQHSCYIAHLTALDRSLALELGCYSDTAVEGSHDWDSFTRFALAGHKPAHVPCAIYTWRMHAASTSTDFRSKPYVFSSQKAVLQRFVDGRGLAERYTVEPSPIFDGTPDWRFAPRAEPAPDTVPTLVLDGATTRTTLEAALAALPDARLLHLHDRAVDNLRDGWAGEALALMELFPDTTMVGGRLHRDGRIVEGGYVFGHGGLFGAPERGQDPAWPGEGAISFKPRSVGAVSARHAVVRRDLLERALPMLPEDINAARLGPWLGALANAAGERVVYTPLFEGQYPADAATPPLEDTVFAGRYGALSRRGTGAAPALPPPEAELSAPPDYRRPGYSAWLADRIQLRAPTASGLGPSLSILTTVYLRTDPVLFRATAAAVAAQTSRPHEWLVLAHGPITPALEAALVEYEAAGLMRRLVLPLNLGIAGGLAHCLEHATGEVVLPLDADDLLTADAVALIRAGFARVPETRILYTDEDLLIEGKVCHPWHRPDADPALLQAHSTIWHSIAFDRLRGLELGAYRDRGAEYALDWDTLLRFHRAGDRALHVPEVTYHWRQHPQSLSHSGGTFAGSAQSVRHLLQGIADATGTPARYRVDATPFRTATPELMLHRMHVDPPSIARLSFGERAGRPLCQDAEETFPFAATHQLALDRGCEGLRALAAALEGISAEYVLLQGAGVALADWRGLWQAIQQLELVSEAIAVAGPLLDAGAILRTGPLVGLPDGGLADPLRGRRYDDPADFSLAHKPHCVTAVSPDLLLARTAALRLALTDIPAGSALRGFGAMLGAVARRTGLRLVYEPLFVGALLDEDAQIGDPVEGLSDHWRAMMRAAPVPERIDGLAGSAWQSLHYE
jgi:glycosyltransferase involved in cell wall biosynthesis